MIIYIIFIYTYLKYRESQEGKTNHPKAVVATTSRPTANRPQLKATRRARSLAAGPVQTMAVIPLRRHKVVSATWLGSSYAVLLITGNQSRT